MEARRLSSRTDRSSKIIFICSIIFAILIWLLMAELGQTLQHVYQKPFFITYFVHSSYLFFLPISWLTKHMWSCRRVISPPSRKESHHIKSMDITSTPPLTELFSQCIPLTIITFTSGWFWFLSLPKTSVSGNSAIYQSSSVVIFVFSVCLLKEKITHGKVLSVTLCFFGVLIISFFGERHSKHSNIDAISSPSLYGYILCVSSMILFSLFEVLFKKWNSHQNNEHSSLIIITQLFGLYGWFTAILFSPLLPILDATRLEVFEVPDPSFLLTFVSIALLDALYNFLVIVAISVSSPLVTSVACLLVLPASVLWDATVNRYELQIVGMSGVVLILIGVLMFAVNEVARNSKNKYNVLRDDDISNDMESKPVNMQHIEDSHDEVQGMNLKECRINGSCSSDDSFHSFNPNASTGNHENSGMSSSSASFPTPPQPLRSIRNNKLSSLKDDKSSIIQKNGKSNQISKKASFVSLNKLNTPNKPTSLTISQRGSHMSKRRFPYIVNKRVGNSNAVAPIQLSGASSMRTVRSTRASNVSDSDSLRTARRSSGRR